MTEAQLLQAVRDLARLRGWLCYHTHDSRHSEPGFPDLMLVHPRTGQVFMVELKSTSGRLTTAQETWLAALRNAGLRVEVWRPTHFSTGHIQAALTPCDIARTA
jgi:hypothetical protein